MTEPFLNKQVLSALVINRGNINTDDLMPKFVLKKVDATGYDSYLFDGWRFNDKGSLDKKLSDRTPNDGFELNVFEKLFKKTPGLLITAFNFGCGSSREHAVWGLVQYGIKVVIGYFDGDKAAFDDIFFNSSPKNGLLLIELPKEMVIYLREACETAHASGAEFPMEVDLENQCIFAGEKKFDFDIDKRTKDKLLKGLDDADEIKANYSKDIEDWEKRTKKEKPFLLEPING
ncbi:MAG TPA: 3-isopropylmalate dehydratase small subunit [Nitrospirae bacterium]|nr:3-isopropylmalate dehydratase small subunit [Nitrospirota bacterium]